MSPDASTGLDGQHELAGAGVANFRKAAFGEIERLVTQKVPDVARGLARDELRSEKWLRVMAQLSARSYEEMRVATVELLDTDGFYVSLESCVDFLDSMIETWQNRDMKRSFAATVWREGDWYVSQCLEVDIASQGETEEEALGNLREALELHFEAPQASRSPMIRTIEVEVGAA